MSETALTKEQVFRAFSERKVGFTKALNVLGMDSYSEFLDEYFQAGYDYPDATNEEKVQAVKDFQELEEMLSRSG